jgi:hypothetical protein
MNSFSFSFSFLEQTNGARSCFQFAIWPNTRLQILLNPGSIFSLGSKRLQTKLIPLNLASIPPLKNTFWIVNEIES